MNTIRLLYLAIVIFFSQALETGFSIGIESFLIPSILMGIGVAIDVALATLAKFQDESLSWRNWTLPVTLTHTFFPAFGYFLFWSLDEALPMAHTALGVTGFILVMLFLYEVLMESFGKEPVFGLSAWVSKKLGFSAGDARTYIAVLAVSWDALWSGPAKAAQASAGAWTGFEVILSFIIAGVVVATIAELSLTTARFLRSRRFSNAKKLAVSTIIGKYFELSVIGGFGVLSLWNALSGNADLYASISIMAIALILVFVLGAKSLYREEIKST